MFTNAVTVSLLVVSLTVFTQTDAASFKSCGGSLGKVVGVDVAGCPASGVCSLKRGQKVSFSLRFTSRVPLEGIKGEALAVFNGVEVKLPGSGQSACSNIKPACSNKMNGKVYTYSRAETLPSFLPTGTYSLKGKLSTASGDLILCAQADVQVV